MTSDIRRVVIDSESALKRAAQFIKIAAPRAQAKLARYVGGAPIQNRWTSLAEVPASTPLSDRLSKDLKAAGFRFCGPTIVYAFMQAVGMVNDHLVTCHRHNDVAAMGRLSSPRPAAP